MDVPRRDSEPDLIAATMKAKDKAFRIIYQQLRRLDLPEVTANALARPLAESFFVPERMNLSFTRPGGLGVPGLADMGDPESEDAASRRELAITLARVLDPSQEVPPEVYQRLDAQLPEMGIAQRIQEARAMDDYGGEYQGRGWSPEQIQQLGRQPAKNELSPGDKIRYQRMLDQHTLQSLAQANDLMSVRSQDVRKYGPDFMQDRQRQYLLAAVQADDIARDKGTAEAYPWHRGWGAFRDATQSHMTYTGNFLEKGQAQSDAAANALMAEEVPALGAAATGYESRYHFGIPSPILPAGMTPQQRDAYAARAEKLIEELRPPSYSESYMYEHGKPPSYAAQGLGTFFNVMADVGTVAGAAGPKLANMAGRALAKTAVPGVAGYGAHLAAKTAAGATAPISSALLAEGTGEGMFQAPLMATSTALETPRPPVWNWFGSGLDNRPDFKAQLLAKGVDLNAPDGNEQFRKYYEAQQERRKQAFKELEGMNAQHPDSFAKPGITNPGAAIGNAAGSFLAPSLLDQGKPGQPGAMPKYMLSR